MSDAQLKRIAPGRYQVSGPLAFETARQLLTVAHGLFTEDVPREIDLSGVGESDSAGLALLIEWTAMAHRAGSSIRFTGIPKQLEALAKISDLDQVLPFGELATAT